MSTQPSSIATTQEQNIGKNQAYLNSLLGNIAQTYSAMLGNFEYHHEFNHYGIKFVAAEKAIDAMLPSLLRAANLYAQLGDAERGRALAQAALTHTELLIDGRYIAESDLNTLRKDAEKIIRSSNVGARSIEWQSPAQQQINHLLFDVISSATAMTGGMKYDQRVIYYSLTQAPVEKTIQNALINLAKASQLYLDVGHEGLALKLAYSTAKNMRHLDKNVRNEARALTSQQHVHALKTLKSITTAVTANNPDAINQYGVDVMRPVDYLCNTMERAGNAKALSSYMKLWNACANSMLENGRADALGKVLEHASSTPESGDGVFERARCEMKRRIIESRKLATVSKSGLNL